MKRNVISLLAAAAFTAGILAGCGTAQKLQSNQESASVSTAAASSDAGATSQTAGEEDKTIKVGAGVTPHAEILEVVKEDLAKEGYDLQIIPYNDYVLPNTALADGDLDANYFQHLPYLENFNKENGTKLVSAAAVHFEPMAIYAGKTKSLDEIQDGATISVPNDATNEARALLLLQDNGLIKLKDGVGVEATKLDIAENPHNLQITELEAAQLPKSIGDVDFAVINGNYAIGAGLTDPVAVEASDSLAAETYANIICVREGEENSPKIQALVKAVLSDKVKEFINEKYNGGVVPVF